MAKLSIALICIAVGAMPMGIAKAQVGQPKSEDTSSAPPRKESPRRSDLAGRVTIRLGSGMSAHTMENSSGPFFFADLAVGYGVFKGLSVELQYAFTFLRTSHDNLVIGVASQVHGIMPGVRYRFLGGTWVPHAGVHLGYARTRDNTEVGGVDQSANGDGFVFDLRAGLEIFLSSIFALDIFASYNFATNVWAATENGREKQNAHYFFVGAGVLFAI